MAFSVLRCLLFIFLMPLATASCNISDCGGWAALLLTPGAKCCQRLHHARGCTMPEVVHWLSKCCNHPAVKAF